jgi:hypothetical protein
LRDAASRGAAQHFSIDGWAGACSEIPWADASTSLASRADANALELIFRWNIYHSRGADCYIFITFMQIAVGLGMDWCRFANTAGGIPLSETRYFQSRLVLRVE